MEFELRSVLKFSELKELVNNMKNCSDYGEITGDEEGTFICHYCFEKIKAYNKYEKRYDEIVDENDQQRKKIEKLMEVIRKLVKERKEMRGFNEKEWK